MVNWYQVVQPTLVTADKVKVYPNGLINLKRSGTYLIWLMNYSGQLKVNILNRAIKVYIFGIYYGQKHQTFDLDVYQLHRHPGSLSELLIRGVFDDCSRFIYKGLIKIEPQAQKSHAYQKNQNLILSDKAHIESDPLLEIEADDVFCTHGSTTSMPSPSQKYYLLSRGIKPKQAQSLIVQGFLSEVVDRAQAVVKEVNLPTAIEIKK